MASAFAVVQTDSIAAPCTVAGCREAPHVELARLLPGCVLRNNDTGEEILLLQVRPQDFEVAQASGFLVALAADVAQSAAPAAKCVSLLFGGAANRAFLQSVSGARVWVHNLLEWSSWQDTNERRFAFRRVADGHESRWRSDLSRQVTEASVMCGDRLLHLWCFCVHRQDVGCRYYWSIAPLVTLLQLAVSKMPPA